METLNPAGNPGLNIPNIPDVDHAAAALATAAEALSKAAQAIAEAALTISDVLAILDNSGMRTSESAVFPGGTHREGNPDVNLGPDLDNFSANPLGEDNCPPKREEFTQDDAAIPRNSSRIQTPLGSNEEMDRFSPVLHLQDTNNKGNPTILPSPKSDSPGVIFEASGAAPQMNVGPSTATASKVQAPEAPTQHISSGSIPTRPNPGPNHETESLDLRRVVMAYPTLPPGRNYIQLDGYMDETSVAAYLALQSHKTICIVRKRAGVQWSAFAKIFNAITKLSVYHPGETGGHPSIENALHAFRVATSPAILLLAHDGLQGILLRSANPDCIIHWGIPLDVSNYVWQMSFFQQPVRSSVLLRWDQNSATLRMWHMSMLKYGIAQYPSYLLHACFGPTSPYQAVLKVSAQVIGSVDAPTSNPEKASGNPSSAKPTIPNAQATKPTRQSADTTPQGHYYIVLDEASDVNIIPFIAYIALRTRSKRTICYLPVGGTRGLGFFQKLLESITDLKALSCNSSVKKDIRPLANQFNSQDYHIFLRRVDDLWSTGFKRPLADSLIYWGVPSDINIYSEKCLQKLTFSCLILTTSQYRQMAAQRPSNRFPLKQYPSLLDIKSPPEGSLLHSLRTKFLWCSRNP